ncbi:MAG: branched-chain amino acid ABC transporter permease, partial [Mycobacteriales bacterium]
MQLDVNYLNEILIFVIFACSLNLLMGYAGQVSVAHGAFAAFGGYALAYLFLNDKFDTLAGLGVGIGAAALAGLVVGFPALRLRTEWLILLTLAAQIIVIELTMTLSNFGGTYGLQNVAGLSVFGHHLLLPTDMLPLFAACAVLVFLLCWRLGESPYGRVLRAIREDEGACRSLGKNVYAYKLTIFAITAAMAGLGGALYVVTLQISSPALFSFDLSTAIIAMVIFGGMGNLFGSVLGATILTLLTPLFENVLDFTTAKAAIWRLIAYGIVLVVVIMVRPQGLLPEGAAPIRFVRQRVA